MNRYSISLWRRIPELDDFGTRIIGDKSSDVGRILDAYGLLDIKGSKVYDYTFKKEEYEHIFMTNDIGRDEWEGEFKVLLHDGGFEKEIPIIEELLDDNLVVIFRGRVKFRAYLSIPLNINEEILFKLTDSHIIKPVIEYNIMGDYLPSCVRLVFKVNKHLLRILKNYGAKKGDIIVMSTSL